VTPFTTEPMVHVVAGCVAVQERGLFPDAVAVAVYPVIAEPFAAGAVQLTASWALRLEVTLTPVGAPGTDAGTHAVFLQ
jgi:hypothetical protein